MEPEKKAKYLINTLGEHASLVVCDEVLGAFHRIDSRIRYTLVLESIDYWGSVKKYIRHEKFVIP